MFHILCKNANLRNSRKFQCVINFHNNANEKSSIKLTCFISFIKHKRNAEKTQENGLERISYILMFTLRASHVVFLKRTFKYPDFHTVTEFK